MLRFATSNFQPFRKLLRNVEAFGKSVREKYLYGEVSLGAELLGGWSRRPPNLWNAESALPFSWTLNNLSQIRPAQRSTKFSSKILSNIIFQFGAGGSSLFRQISS
jgi:hypothetical protein